MLCESEPYTLSLLNETNTPTLDEIDATYILSMEGNERYNFIDIELLNLSRVTYLQKNKGFEFKEDVNSTCEDIVHAVKNICKHAKSYGNILILEDDAEMMCTACSEDFHSINMFLKTTKCNIYSFGSLGLIYPVELAHFKFFKFLGFAQGIMYSKFARENLLHSVGVIRHIDAHFLSYEKDKYTYYKPLIVQKFETSENMKEWSLSKKNYLIENYCVHAFICIIQYLLCLKYRTHGWFLIYIFNHSITSMSIAIFSFVFISYIL